MIKIFGVGNILLCDDGIGVKIVEKIKDEIEKLSKDIEVIIGETDYMYCLDCINKEDIVIIVDSTYLGLKPGVISIFDFKECDRFITNSRDEHNESLLKILRKEYREVNGYLIGIEIEIIDFSLELSKTLKNEFLNISIKVFNEIKNILKRIYGEDYA
ncbi:hydrogenase maturation protease [Clostridium sp. ZBS15]|uniref:hydrogenase maturation protease n=1 Tax=Clostridium sp. ZBS15 TaxID=2949969 RepID=UPI002079753E|nr:hydrogenase maturation protease [Clostridium sp. ZBS15]